MLVEDTIFMSIKNEQDKEERLHVIKQLLSKGPYKDYTIENGIVMKKVSDRNVVVLPLSMYNDTIRRVKMGILLLRK